MSTKAKEILIEVDESKYSVKPETIMNNLLKARQDVSDAFLRASKTVGPEMGQMQSITMMNMREYPDVPYHKELFKQAQKYFKEVEKAKKVIQGLETNLKKFGTFTQLTPI
ncbi:MAG: hypothetical protein B7C24_15310 [Bacteroidetes bacterium 4572_77]|nr:MAG: hypothetical protein B7C24_15310 [Bacteroidetes bacterium 4572_77]